MMFCGNFLIFINFYSCFCYVKKKEKKKYNVKFGMF